MSESSTCLVCGYRIRKGWDDPIHHCDAEIAKKKAREQADKRRQARSRVYTHLWHSSAAEARGDSEVAVREVKAIIKALQESIEGLQ